MSLCRLIYASRVAQSASVAYLEQIFESAAVNNKKLGVAKMLVF
jgi:hypothetical protein